MLHNEWSNIIPATWTTAVSSALLQHNRFARELHFMSDLSTQECPNAHLILSDGGVGEIAAILRLDNTAAGNYTPKSMVIRKRDNSVSQIGSISRLWEPLAYPLPFPHGTLGWGKLSGINRQYTEEEYLHGDSTVTQIWHYRSRLLRAQIFEIFGRLANEYMVDMWTMEEDAELMGVAEVETPSNI
ncbi:hypothetical protein M422DRAFT_272899 [Sphaerobolus stellatus SS14]|uniref:Uncharacterized protein n=1 Tax=Sphaerobolus stellatus (strain SS14) TaxID=990650 RepID=A0A0C9TAF9_SPHS4|nr:hypothetical protein M422DRAFT_272899 [Sphaerobolus stellatus SS14]